MPPAVTTSYGRVEGLDAAGLDVFRGIPFAAPPVGPRRFRPPQRPEPWSGVREATRFGPVPPQLPGAYDKLLGYDFDRTDEDCLYLNIWRPTVPSPEPRPVMVWIPGGAFSTGGGSLGMYDGSALARRGNLVVVTVNYRLGPFGWLHGKSDFGDALPSTGNEGLLDLVAALEWVRDEIAAFGGDPANVTLFGESAGAAAITTLLGTPAARGLIHRAIAGSGTALHMQTLEMRREYAQLLVAALRVADDPGRLRDLSTAEIMQADGRVLAAMARAKAWPLPHSPVVDGDVLPQHPAEAVAAGMSAGVPFITGTTAEELKLFAGMDPGARDLDEERLVARLESRFGAEHPGLPQRAVDHYRASRAAAGRSTEPVELWYAIESDRQLFSPVVHFGELQAAHAGTYMYEFTWTSPLDGGIYGSCHALDLAFVFGTYARADLAPFFGTGPAADALSAHIQDAWAAFARTGDPNNPGLPHWPVYTVPARQTMEFGARFRLHQAPKEAERSFWETALRPAAARMRAAG